MDLILSTTIVLLFVGGFQAHPQYDSSARATAPIKLDISGYADQGSSSRSAKALPHPPQSGYTDAATEQRDYLAHSQRAAQKGYSLDNSVLCRPTEGSDGSITYDCDAPKPDQSTLRSKHVLWLDALSGSDRDIRINVPNYRIEDVIQAAHKEGGSGGLTNIAINLQKPEISYIAEKEEKVGQQQQTFNVELLYERLGGKTVHFADEGASSQRYSPLRQAIREP